MVSSSSHSFPIIFGGQFYLFSKETKEKYETFQFFILKPSFPFKKELLSFGKWNIFDGQRRQFHRKIILICWLIFDFYKGIAKIPFLLLPFHTPLKNFMHETNTLVKQKVFLAALNGTGQESISRVYLHFM